MANFLELMDDEIDDSPGIGEPAAAAVIGTTPANFLDFLDGGEGFVDAPALAGEGSDDRGREGMGGGSAVLVHGGEGAEDRGRQGIDTGSGAASAPEGGGGSKGFGSKMTKAEQRMQRSRKGVLQRFRNALRMSRDNAAKMAKELRPPTKRGKLVVKKAVGKGNIAAHSVVVVDRRGARQATGERQTNEPRLYLEAAFLTMPSSEAAAVQL